MKSAHTSAIAETTVAHSEAKVSVAIDVALPSFSRDGDAVRYRVEVRTRISSHAFERRYSEFRHFAQSLRKRFPLRNWPTFPPKIWFGKFNSEKLENRRALLEQFLKSVVRMFARSSELEVVSGFLEIPQSDVRMLKDISASKLPLNNKCLNAYLALVYRPAELLPQLAAFLRAATATRMPPRVAEAIVAGDGALPSIFVEAFARETTAVDASLASAGESFFARISANPLSSDTAVVPTPTVHYRCALLAMAIAFLFDTSACVNATLFRALFRSAQLGWLAAFQEHLQSPAPTPCKQICYGLLRTFLELNPLCNLGVVFTVVEEREQFELWLRARAPQGDALRDRALLPRPFPRMDRLICDGFVAVDCLAQAFERLSVKPNIGAVAHNTHLHYSRLSFLLHRTRRDDFIATMEDFRWSRNKLKIHFRRPPTADTHIASKQSYFHKSFSEADEVVASLWVMYKAEVDDKVMLVFVTEESTDEQLAQFDEFLQNFPEAKDKKLQFTANNTGVFVEIAPDRRDPQRLTVSVVVAFGFRHVERDGCYETFASMISTLKDIQRHCDEHFTIEK